MSTQAIEMTTAETLQKILRVIPAMPEQSIKKLAGYVEELIEEEEEAEDIAYIKAHRNDGPVIPWSEVVAEFEAEHGSLY